MRVLVCGGRDYSNKEELWAFLDDLHAGGNVSDIIQGGARGADKLALEWALSVGVTSIEYAADWKTLGKKAGILRNINMLYQGKPDLVVACPGGVGTAHMVDLATKEKVKVLHTKGYLT